MGAAQPFSHRLLSSVLYLFFRDHYAQLSLDSASPCRRVSTGSRGQFLPDKATEPPSEKQATPFTAACLFCRVMQRVLRGDWSPASSGCPSSQSHPVAAAASPCQPPQCLGCQVKGSLAKEREISALFLSPPSPRLVLSWTK